MKNPFDEVWSILASRKLSRERLCKRASEFVREKDGALAGFRIADGPEVVVWAKEPNRLRYLLNIAADAPCFAGHFPGNPILPGIIQLHWAVLLARRHLSPPALPMQIKGVKFRNTVRPPRLLELRLEPLDVGRVAFSLIGKAGIHSLGSLVFPESS